jgi:hypothetical protein
VGTDFFTVEVLTLKGLVTYYVLFFIQLESRRVCVAGITPVWSRNSKGLKRRGLQARLVSSDCLAAKMSFLTLRQSGFDDQL